MSLLVAGAPQSIATAAYASAVSSERVLVEADSEPLPTVLELDGGPVPVDLARMQPGDRVTSVILVVESRYVKHAIDQLGDLLDGTSVLLAPGGFAGALRFERYARAAGIGACVAECTGFPVAGAHGNGGTLQVSGVKRHLPFAAARPGRTEQMLGQFLRYLPHLEASDLATTSLANTNHLIHPPLVLLNAIRIQNAEAFRFYREGVSPAANALLTAVDDERMRLCAAVGADTRSGMDWLLGFYGAEGMTGASMDECLRTYPPFGAVSGPTSLDYRYVVDDVPHGMGQWAALGDLLGVETPTIDRVTGLLDTLLPGRPLAPRSESADMFVERVLARSPV